MGPGGIGLLVDTTMLTTCVGAEDWGRCPRPSAFLDGPRQAIFMGRLDYSAEPGPDAHPVAFWHDGVRNRWAVQVLRDAVDGVGIILSPSASD